MTNNPAHTPTSPLPWRTEQNKECSTRWIVDKNRETVCDLLPSQYADGELIVKSVNRDHLFEEMRETLKDLLAVEADLNIANRITKMLQKIEEASK